MVQDQLARGLPELLKEVAESANIVAPLELDKNLEQTVAGLFAAIGFELVVRGEKRKAAGWFVQAAWRQPSLLRNRGVISVMIESVIGTRWLRWLQAWRR